MHEPYQKEQVQVLSKCMKLHLHQMHDPKKGTDSDSLQMHASSFTTNA